MISYGLKLWTSNENWFDEAVVLYQQKKIHFVELYHDASKTLDFKQLQKLKQLPITIHNTNDHGFHEFIIKKPQLAVWSLTVVLADFFTSKVIIVHPGKHHTLHSFQKNLAYIDDPRILIENMAGLDIYGEPMFAHTLVDLKRIHHIKPICFDFEKAMKSACYQKINYKNFIQDCIEALASKYFHISGGDKNNPIDEHSNLWEANFDIEWIRKTLAKKAERQELFLVFETPKQGTTLENDYKNMQYFLKL